jgi:heptaprenylglyceryl phosphate synthase
MPPKRTPKKKPAKASLLLGVGLDDDGEKRVTKGRDFILVGGSKDTHEELTERAIKVNEELDRRGIRLSDVRGPEEMREIVDKAWG